jgi:hypothetical protein
MAKSRSTTTPTKASSSKTKDKDHTGGHRSSRANVSTRSASAQSSPSKRKADDHTDGSRSSKRRAVADSDATPQRAIPVRPARSKGKGKEVAKSELELFKERHNSLFPRGVTVKRETPDAEPEPEPEPDADNIFVRPPSPIKPDDKERLLDYVLLGTFGFEARQHAVDQLFEAARESAALKADFGVAYVEATVNRLKRKGIKEQRLTEVLTMVQDGLCEQVRARVDSFGGPLSLPSPLSLPQDFGQAASRASNIANRTGVAGTRESHSPRQSPVVVPHKRKQRSAGSESVHTHSESDSSSDDDETIVPGSQKNSKFRDDDDEDYVENSNASVPHREHVKHEDGMISSRLTWFSQSHTNKTIW